MTKTATAPANTNITDELRRYFHIGPRTRRYRESRDLHEAMFEAIGNEYRYPGFYHESLGAALRSATTILFAWDKFVYGYRLPGTTHHALTSLSPWKLTALIGRMVDEGVTNNGEAERWFSANRDEIEGWVR